jgi:hypothetical protein
VAIKSVKHTDHFDGWLPAKPMADAIRIFCLDRIWSLIACPNTTCEQNN